MNRESLLDEAIAKAKEAEDWQLVEWLRMARGGESAARWYTAKLDEARLDMGKLMTENVRLRELVRMLINCADSISVSDEFYERDIDGCGFSCTANGENCSFTKMCNYARELGVEVDE